MTAQRHSFPCAPACAWACDGATAQRGSLLTRGAPAAGRVDVTVGGGSSFGVWRGHGRCGRLGQATARLPHRVLKHLRAPNTQPGIQLSRACQAGEPDPTLRHRARAAGAGLDWLASATRCGLCYIMWAGSNSLRRALRRATAEPAGAASISTRAAPPWLPGEGAIIQASASCQAHPQALCPPCPVPMQCRLSYAVTAPPAARSSCCPAPRHGPAAVPKYQPTRPCPTPVLLRCAARW
jgi:hypothetical protein